MTARDRAVWLVDRGEKASPRFLIRWRIGGDVDCLRIDGEFRASIVARSMAERLGCPLIRVIHGGGGDRASAPPSSTKQPASIGRKEEP
jgi:hypothetical protein